MVLRTVASTDIRWLGSKVGNDTKHYCSRALQGYQCKPVGSSCSNMCTDTYKAGFRQMCKLQIVGLIGPGAVHMYFT